MSNGWNDQGVAHGNQRLRWSRELSCFIFISKEILPLSPGPFRGQEKPSDLQSVPTGRDHSSFHASWFTVVTLEHLAINSLKNCTESTDLPSTDVAAGVWLVPERRRSHCPEKEEVHGSMMDRCLQEVSDPLGLDASIHHKLSWCANHCSGLGKVSSSKPWPSIALCDCPLLWVQTEHLPISPVLFS